MHPTMAVGAERFPICSIKAEIRPAAPWRYVMGMVLFASVPAALTGVIIALLNILTPHRACVESAFRARLGLLPPQTVSSRAFTLLGAETGLSVLERCGAESAVTFHFFVTFASVPFGW